MGHVSPQRENDGCFRFMLAGILVCAVAGFVLFAATVLAEIVGP